MFHIRCTAGSRTFVHKSVYEEFVKKAAERAKKLTVGHPFQSDLGPLVDKDQFERVLSCIISLFLLGTMLLCTTTLHFQRKLCDNVRI